MTTELHVEAERALLGRFLSQHPGEAAREIQVAPVDEGAALLAQEPPQTAAEVLRRMAPDQAAAVLASAPVELARLTLPEIDPVRSATILAWLDDDTRAARLALLPLALAKEIEAIAAFPPGTAGRAWTRARCCSLPARR